MNIINASQGSAEWLAVRARHFTASEAPAMMGASKYQTRQELLRQKHTGLATDVDENTQRLFDRGHAAESAARPIVEGIIGAELFPATGAQEVHGLPLLASFDGLTMLEDTVWENKLFNAALADQVRAGQLEPHYFWQLEQQLLVSAAGRVYFTTSDGTAENTVGMWYASYPERRDALIAGWKQFAEDLANYQHVETVQKPVATVVEALPALLIQVEGKVLFANLDAFKARAQTFIDSIKTSLTTDQDFSDAEQLVKFLKDGEDKLDLAKQQALAQTASIDEVFRTVDAISAQMRSKRLALDKLVKSEKEARKAQIVEKATGVIERHCIALNERIGGRWMPLSFVSPARFADAIKGKKSLASMHDAVDTELAHVKIEANEIADRIEANYKAIPEDKIFLFPDFGHVCMKTAEDFDALLSHRYGQHLKAQEAERERIRQEEAERIAREAAQAANDQRGKVDVGIGLERSGHAQSESTSTQPITGSVNDDAIITEFMALLPISLAEKKTLRVTLDKFVKYQHARMNMGVAA